MKPLVLTNENFATDALTDGRTFAGNRFSICLFIVAFFFSVALLAWLTWSTYDLYTRDTTIREQAWHAGELHKKIIHLDEVLTRSASMATKHIPFILCSARRGRGLRRIVIRDLTAD